MKKRSDKVDRVSSQYRDRSLLSCGLLYAQASKEIFLETFWPTRCVICGAPGEVLCRDCEHTLPYIDFWKACPACGASLGLHQCVECSSFSLAQKGIESLPFNGCVSATVFDNDITGKIVRAHKDLGERRLAGIMGRIIAQAIPPEWVQEECAVTYIPATRKALQRRGFDHGYALGTSVASWVGLPSFCVFNRPKTHDQRKLSRGQRFVNMNGRFSLNKSSKLFNKLEGAEIIIVDDVYTTGATLCSAAQILRDAGVSKVYCATFTRV